MTKPIRIKDIMDNERHRRQYDYTEIEDRLRLKLDILQDKLRDLTSAELKELESGLDAFTRMAELFLKRHGTPTEPERPEPAPITNRPPSGVSGQTEGFQGQADNPMPLVTDIDKVNFGGLIKLADKFGVSHNESQWLNGEWRDREGELRAAVAEAMEKVGK